MYCQTLDSSTTAQCESDNAHGMRSGYIFVPAAIIVAFVATTAYYFAISIVRRTSEVFHAQLLQSVINTPLSFFSDKDIGFTTNCFS